MIDLISKSAAQAINVLPKCYRNYQTDNLDDAYEKGWEDALFSLNALPTIDPVKHSRWVFPTDIVGFGRCENCKALWDISLIRNKFFKHFPKCGARMDEGKG